MTSEDEERPPLKEDAPKQNSGTNTNEQPAPADGAAETASDDGSDDSPPDASPPEPERMSLRVDTGVPKASSSVTAARGTQVSEEKLGKDPPVPTRTSNDRLRKQLDAQKLIEQGLQNRNKDLEKQLKEQTVQKNKIRNQIEFDLMDERDFALQKVKEAHDRQAKADSAKLYLQVYGQELQTQQDCWLAHLATTKEDVSAEDVQKDIEELRAAHPELSTEQLVQEEVLRQVTRIVTDTDQYKAYVAAGVKQERANGKANADAKITDGKADLERRSKNLAAREAFIEELLKKFRSMNANDLEERERFVKQASAGRALPPEPPKYALKDPKIVQLRQDEYLGGYIDASMALERRAAVISNYDVPKEQIAYLYDRENKHHPFQRGIEIGQRFGWRTICQNQHKPEWDESLDTRVWQVDDFWPIRENFLPDGVFGGMQKGLKKAEEAFKDRLAREEKTASKAPVSTPGMKSRQPSATTSSTSAPKTEKATPRPSATSSAPPKDTGSATTQASQSKQEGLNRSRFVNRGQDHGHRGSNHRGGRGQFQGGRGRGQSTRGRGGHSTLVVLPFQTPEEDVPPGYHYYPQHNGYVKGVILPANLPEADVPAGYVFSTAHNGYVMGTG